jgi:hypothetical protein
MLTCLNVKSNNIGASLVFFVGFFFIDCFNLKISESPDDDDDYATSSAL